MKYWMAVMSRSMWRDFQESSFAVLGFSRGVRFRARKPKRDDVIICCLTSKHQWVGAFTIVGATKVSHKVYRANLPVLYEVKSVAIAPVDQGIPAKRPKEFVRAASDLSISRSPYEFRYRGVAEDVVKQLCKLDPSSGFKISRPAVPEDLVKACRGGECVAYVGSGLAAAGGMPTWGSFVTDLMEWAISKKYFSKDYAVGLREAVTQQQYNVVADTVVSNIDKPLVIADYLKSVFEKEKAPTLRTYDLLREIPFSALLTTNFDDLLEQTLAGRCRYTPQWMPKLCLELKQLDPCTS
jgi:hypothetical protein